jgi:hypothetical protein
MKKAVEFIQSFVVIALVLAGIGGLSYNMFRDDGGWLEAILGKLWDIGTRHTLFAVFVAIAATIVFMLWRHGKGIHGRTSKLPDLIVYAVMAAGVYFIGRYFITGKI